MITVYIYKEKKIMLLKELRQLLKYKDSQSTTQNYEPPVFKLQEMNVNTRHTLENILLDNSFIFTW